MRDCIEWTGSKNQRGRGQVRVGRVQRTVTRVIFEIILGPLPANIKVLHTCDNPSCINHEHLFLGTQKDNVDDMYKKGRASVGSKRPQAKLTESQVISIRKQYEEEKCYGLQSRLARKYGVSYQTIQAIVNNKTWRRV